MDEGADLPVLAIEEPVYGWRAWNLSPHGLSELMMRLNGEEPGGDDYLYSPVYPARWPHGEPLGARVSPGVAKVDDLLRALGGDANAPPIPYGIHAAKDPIDAMAYSPYIGRVALGGRVLVCEAGYRASHGYPVEVWLPDDRRAAFERAYGITTHDGARFAKLRLDWQATTFSYGDPYVVEYNARQLRAAIYAELGYTPREAGEVPI